MFSRHTHQVINLICLLTAAFLMPVSVWLLSVVSIIMSVNWLISGEFRRKFNILKSRRGIMPLLLLFVMYLVWLVNTTDSGSAMTELKVKLPLLFFPVVAGSAEWEGRTMLRAALISFIAGCVFAAGAGFLALAGIIPVEIQSPRDLALFVPSIRLSILLCFGIFAALWLSATDHSAGLPAFRKKQFSPLSGELPGNGISPVEINFRVPEGRPVTIVLTAAAAAMSLFLFRLLSVTGIVLFVLCLGLTGAFVIFAGKRVAAGLFLLAAAAAVATAMVILGSNARHRLLTPADPSVNRQLSTTLSGNNYSHYPEETLVENGYLVWMNVCEEELRQEWDRRSRMDYDGMDLTGNELRVTLIRYITALGMAKDSAAVSVLTEADIMNIERGFANPLYSRKGSPFARAYELAWELQRVSGGGNPSGLSLVQRPEFYRAAAGIIRKHPWTGVGTGDVAGAFRDEYASNSTPLRIEYRLRAHNQFLTFGVTFGIPGMIFAVCLILLPWFTGRNRFSYLFLIFMTIMIASMFNDDTFSSFTGTAFFSYFYTLLIVTSAYNET